MNLKKIVIFFLLLCLLPLHAFADITVPQIKAIAPAEVPDNEAMKFLQDYYRIPREKCMAFGDYLNDYTMMKACHYSFAMENAHPKLKEIANFQTSSNDYMGVMNMVSVMTE